MKPVGAIAHIYTYSNSRKYWTQENVRKVEVPENKWFSIIVSGRTANALLYPVVADGR
jgi:hypothetical protein